MKYWKNGFYDEQSEIKDRFEIDDDKWTMLLNGQADGLEIYTKQNGEPDLRVVKPSEKDLIEFKINELKELLIKTDYVAMKYAEGIISDEEYSTTKNQRQIYRGEINKLQEELDKYKE